MKKKLLAIVLSETMLAFVLAGCGSNQSAQENSESQEVTEDTVHEQDAELESGKVELTVWAEANNFETLDGILAVAEVADKKFSMEITSGWYMYSFFGGTGLDFGINDDGVTNHCNWNTTEGAIKGTDIAEAMLNVTASPAFFSQPDNSCPSVLEYFKILFTSKFCHLISFSLFFHSGGKKKGSCKLTSWPDPFFFFFLLFRAARTAYGSSQARG